VNDTFRTSKRGAMRLELSGSMPYPHSRRVWLRIISAKMIRELRRIPARQVWQP
jgi:hypothetical protein